MNRLSVMAASIALLAACDYRGDFLFPGENPDIPGVYDFGVVEVTQPGDAAGVHFAEIGPANVAVQGGATARFEGTGGDVCVWVDPEAVTWNTSVGPAGDVTLSYPDNVFDDGDVDIEVGQAIFYTGVLGEDIGDFSVSYIDELGNPVDVALNLCTITDIFDEVGSHSGRAAAEYCTISNTTPSVEYMIAISTWNTPLDDDVLSFGLLVTDGSCDLLKQRTGVSDLEHEECVIREEARDGGVPRPGFYDFEQQFCWMPEVAGSNPPTGALPMNIYCAQEAEIKDCKVERCYCGDPTDLPNPI